MENRRRQNNRTRHRLNAFGNTVIALAVAVGLFFVVFGLWLIPERVSGSSMAPTFAEDEIILVSRISKYFVSPRRGDVILFCDPGGNGLMIRRVIGLEGETVETVGGRTFIGSCPLDESAYLPAEIAAGDSAPLEVPENAYYVLGDNRGETYDSRTASFGCIRTEEIIGIVRVRISPLSRLTFFG